MVRPINII